MTGPLARRGRAPARSLLAVPALLISALVPPFARADEPVDFNRDVRPILSDRCFACHGPDASVRQASLRLDQREVAVATLPAGRRVIAPSDVRQSELLRRVTSDDPAVRMPPDGEPLGAGDVETLSRWIAQGARYADHWSFTSPVRPAPPVADRHPIDAFVDARLEREGLVPVGEASPERLLRRVTLDLTGLPPTVAELDAFLRDDREDRYPRAVDRLLASPRHGEEMARHWLDVARFGDTHGYHLDNVRSLWPWRDWVVNAFNDNMPLDRFAVEQLAGDLLPDATRDQLVATGFNRCNPTTGEGGLIAEEYLARYAMDRVDTFSTAFLGLTTHCAQCHDHKYDPISQREYYELFAFFNNLDEQASDNNALAPPPRMKVPTADEEASLADLDARIADLRARMDAPDPEMDAGQAAWEDEWRARLDGRFIDLAPRSAVSQGGARVELLEDRSIRFTGDNPVRDVYDVVAATARPIGGVVALRLDALVDPDVGGIGRASHHNIVLTGVEVEVAPLTDPLRRTPVTLVAAAADHNQRDFPIQNAIDDDPASGWAIAGGVDEPRTAVFRFAEPVAHAEGTLFFVRLRQESGYSQHNFARVRLAVSDRDVSAPSTSSTWRIAGPFAVKDGRAAHSEELGPERLPFDASATFHDGAIAWVERPDLVDEKVHDLEGALAATYLHRTLTTPAPRALRIAVGSDDGVRIWLNGDLVLDRPAPRSVAPDQDFVTLPLVAGSNDLVMKVTNYGGGFAFYHRVVAEPIDGVPGGVARALVASADQRNDDDRGRLRRYYRELHSEPWRALDAKRQELEAERKKVDDAVAVTMVSRERAERRPARVLIRGRYDRPGDPVEPGVPAAIAEFPDDLPRNRLGLARWLVDPEHPLFARVFVNRLWQQLFGVGLVKTSEDFGMQGEWPSHPKLLDWLAVELVESGFDVRGMIRLMVTSDAYHRSAAASDVHRRVDPDNRLLARASRPRLDAEVIRDAALFHAGLLVERLGGPSVKPYQPPGIWYAVGYTSSNTARFKRDDGDALYRRSLYTFWKRTAPPPTLAMFDAPSREACTVRRARTNTPLQALALLNDEQFVEAARGFGERLARMGGDDESRMTHAFQSVTSRTPDDVELELLCGLLEEQRSAYERDSAAAAALLGVGEHPTDAALPEIDRYAWTCVANALLNLDETITRG